MDKLRDSPGNSIRGDSRAPSLSDIHGGVRRRDAWGKEGDNLCVNMPHTSSFEKGNITWRQDVSIRPLVTLLQCVHQEALFR